MPFVKVAETAGDEHPRPNQYRTRGLWWTGGGPLINPPDGLYEWCPADRVGDVLKAKEPA